MKNPSVSIVSILALFLISFQSSAQLSLTVTDPGRNETGVSLNTIIILQFSADVDPATTPISFSVQSNLRGRLPVVINTSGNSVTLTPAFPFLPAEEIWVTVLSTLKSTSANPLTAPTAFQFSTAPQPPTSIPPNFVERELSDFGSDGVKTTAPADVDKDGDIDICYLGWSSGSPVGWLENDHRL